MTRYGIGKSAGLAAAGALLVCTAAVAAPEAAIVIESRRLDPADLRFDVRLDTSVTVSTAQNDLSFSAGTRIAARLNGTPHCSVNPAIEKQGSGFAFQPPGCNPATTCTAVRAIITSIDAIPIPSGSVLYTCTLDPATPPGVYMAICSNPRASDALPVEVECVDGELTVEGDSTLVVGSPDGDQGTLVPVTVTLRSNQRVVRVEGDLIAPPGTAIASVSGRPACTASEAIDVTSSFVFVPLGCTVGVDCSGVRMVVESAPPALLPADASIFTCQLAIAADAAPGDHPLRLTDVAAANDAGAPLAVRVIDGVVQVGVPPLPTPTPTPSLSNLEIGSAAGAAGSHVSIAVTLHTSQVIAGTQNDVGFVPAFAIAVRSDGRPACTIAPPLAALSQIGFQPQPCEPGVDCTGVRAIIVSADLTPIADGTMLYSCDVAIAPDATGSAAMLCSNQGAADPSGNPVSIDCDDGAVSVLAPPTPTRTVDSHTTASDDGGCQVRPPDRAADAPFLLAPLVWVLCRRRTPRRA